MENLPFLTMILAMPIVATIIIAFLPREADKPIKWTAAVAMGIATVLSAYLFLTYDKAAGGLQFVERVPWIADLGVDYFLAVDGISLILLFLCSVVGFAAVFSSWNVTERSREFFILLLLLVTGVMGTFVSFDLFIFLLFYELIAIPTYLMILVWGTTKRVTKEYAGLKLSLYLLMAGASLIFAFIAMYIEGYNLTGVYSFDLVHLAQAGFDPDFQKVIFLFLLFGFGTTLTMFPFHSWSPDGHAAAPAAVSMIHAGVLKKIGVYGLIRIAMGVLPAGFAFWAPYVAVIAAISIVYSALIAIAQSDLKYLVGFSSVSHMSYMLLGIASMHPIGIAGAVGYMFAHGMITAISFSMVGFIYERTHTRDVNQLGGLANRMPLLTVGVVLGGFTSLGLPGLVAFVPEFTIFTGLWHQGSQVSRWVSAFAITSVVLTALYALRMVAKTVFGPPKAEYDHLKDLRGPEKVPVYVLGFLLILGGVMPFLLLDMANSGIAPLVANLGNVIAMGVN